MTVDDVAWDQDLTRVGNHVEVLRRGWPLILLGLVAGLLLGYGYDQIRPVEYTSTGSLLVEPAQLNGSTNPLEPEEVATEAKLVEASEVAEWARSSLGLEASVEELAATVTATPVEDTRVIEVTAVRGSAEEAAEVSQAFLDAYLAYRSDLGVSGDGRPPVRPFVVGAPEPPAEPSSTSLPVLLAITGFAGLIVGLLAAYVRVRRVVLLRDEEDVRRVVGDIPVLGQAPRARADRRGRLSTSDASAGRLNEPYRRLSMNVRYLPVVSGTGRRVSAEHVLFAPVQTNRLHAPATCNLAVAAARSGMDVVLIDADLEDRTVGSRFGLPESARGLIDLIGGATVDDVLHDVGEPGLRVMPTGLVNGDEAPLTQSTRLGEAWARIAKTAELVMVNGGPLLEAAENIELAPHVGVVLVSAPEGALRADDLVEVRERLARVGANVDGLVWTNARVGR